MESLIAAKKESWLIWFFRGILFLGTLVLLTRLVELQVVKGNYYRHLAEGNRIARIRIPAPRGKIYARGGEILVDSVLFNDQYQRHYLYSQSLAHLTGYLGEINEDEVGKVDPQCLHKGVHKLGAFIGRSGLEQEYDCLLKGIDGEELIEVDTLGNAIRILGKKEPISGQDIKTTINLNLQKKVAEVMEDKKGAVVISDGEGEILALFSSPSYPPEKASEYVDDPDLAMFDRAIGGIYHPGSVFKIVTAMAALEEGEIDANYIYQDPGVITVNDFDYTNWYFSQYGRTEGEIGLVRALARSTDTFFYKIGEFVGAERLADWAEEFGLGTKTGIDLPGEIGGLIPDPGWKKRVKREAWFLGNTYHMAIGQGDIALTPLEVNLMTAVIANGGKLCSPRIVAPEKIKCLDLKLDPNNIQLVREGLIAACQEGGTGYPFFDFHPEVACKTGTAETEEKDKTHAWFTVFAPIDNPELVLTIMIEKGGEGSQVAAPIAREIFDYYFNP